MTARLQVEDLHVAIGGSTVLRGLNLAVGAGELLGLVGPNGSGKSTLLRCIAGTQSRLAGRIVVDGHDLDHEPLALRRALSVAVEPERLPAELSGRQCLELIAELRGETASLAASWALAEALRFLPWLDLPVAGYSLGTRQKLCLLLALLGQPRLLLLDEVLNGLDPLAAWALKQELRSRVDAGSSVILATHGLEVAERFLDRAVLLLDGRLAADWGSAELAAFRADPEGGLEHAVSERLRHATSG